MTANDYRCTAKLILNGIGARRQNVGQGFGRSDQTPHAIEIRTEASMSSSALQAQSEHLQLFVAIGVAMLHHDSPSGQRVKH
jgi:hypothetical protein